jgi:thiosulfate/3-mercaptopyruvate sulfurtransferase
MVRHIVEAEWLKEHLEDRDIRIVDCRFYLGEKEKGYEEYKDKHIPGALYADLEHHLSGKARKHGGRHPLPRLVDFIDFIESIGISNETTIVAYDSQAGAMASRFWWMMKYIGHEKVYVLNGGFPNWLSHSYPLSSDTPFASPGSYHPSVQPEMLASMEEVKQHIDASGLLIDSREERRFAGVEEPIDSAAGHIPGAVNKFWRESMDENGLWKVGEELQNRFPEALEHESIIVYCGSGVTACPNVLALSELGFSKVKLYAGSWSDWISYEDNPIDTVR